MGAGRGTNTGFGVVTAIARVETAVEGAADGAVLGDPTRAATPTSKAVSADKPPIAAIVPRNTLIVVLFVLAGAGIVGIT